MNRYEAIAAKIVDEGIPMLLKDGRGIDLKLKHCPSCGSFVKLNYGQGLRYSAVTWHCSDQGCPMSDNWLPLDGWNEDNPPSFGVLMETVPVPVGC